MDVINTARSLAFSGVRRMPTKRQPAPRRNDWRHEKNGDLSEPSDDPTPRSTLARCIDFSYQVVEREVLYLDAPKPVRRSFFSVLARRRTRRRFGRLLPADLSTILWFTAKTLETTWRPGATLRPPSQRHWEHRVPPSAGGCHPIDTLVLLHPSADEVVYLYDPLQHVLRKLKLADRECLRSLTLKLASAIDLGSGTVLWHVAQPQRTASKYNGADSLVWRDAGALVATTSFVAEALGLAACPIGMTGEPELSNALAGEGRVRGVGGCVVGSRI